MSLDEGEKGMLGSITMMFSNGSNSMRTVRCRTAGMLKRHIEITVLVSLLALLLIGQRSYLRHPSALLALVDWETIATLAGIILITTSIRRSRLFGKVAAGVLVRLDSERMLAIALSVLTAGMSTFLTNDISLLVVVPLTLSLQEYVDNDMTKIMVFEAIAANVGSALTPIGNPQNLFLWHRWGLTFGQVVRAMAAPVGLMSFLLLVVMWFSFRNRKLEPKVREVCDFNPRLAVLSLTALAVYVAMSEFRLSLYAFLPLFALFLFVDRDSVRQADWALAGMFILMFVDFHMLAAVHPVSKVLSALGSGGAGEVFFGSVLASQIVSNVPAAILVSQFSHSWRAIAYGVNVGGNGLFIGSLANLIVLKMSGDRRIWRVFHLYSLPYLAVSAALVYFLLL